MIIRKAEIKDVDECLECVKNSKLWDAYFADLENNFFLLNEIKKENISVVENEEGQCVGFMGLLEDGCFRKFPYLSILAVHKEFRNNGIGKMLLDHFETMGFAKEKRVFVLCSDFNSKAQKFYRENGFVECGKIEDLFKEGIAEHLFVKYNDTRDE